MPSLESVEPGVMARIAVVMRNESVRQVLVELADAGVAEVETSNESDSSEALEALRRLRAAGVAASGPKIAATLRTPSDLERLQLADLLAGEVELERHAAAAVARGPFKVAVGWCPVTEIPALSSRLESLGAGIVRLPAPPFVEPPTQLRTPRAAEPFRPLVETYGTIRYRDIDPTPFTAVSFVLMFGMMFADAGHGLVLAAAGLALRFSNHPRLHSLKKSWAVPFACGLSAALFGIAYGEFFGPTGAVPVLWLRPLQNPLELLLAGVLVGAVLLAISYVIGAVNRWREGGMVAAFYSSSGIAGALLFASLAALAVSVWAKSTLGLVIAAAMALIGLGLIFAGNVANAGHTSTRILEAIVETFSAVLRLGANSISFARLAAFGMVHAAIGSLVWTATIGFVAAGMLFAAIPVFVVGNVIAFSLELLVAAIQALRLEYYELFSRIYSGEGRPFKPWRLPVIKEAT
ncbi:MAG TPA: V-type ATPase 116kDa subunit family protein [Candidatus Dormibacteraeota bacterium]|nr:V-type ATPase 116kDa subunit family protein [Candidatus Dormibacteraeota bacterium]